MPADIQDRVFDFIVKFKADNDGVSPSYREIMEACDISSFSHVKYLLGKLAAGGRISLGDGKSRTIYVTGGQWQYEEPVAV